MGTAQATFEVVELPEVTSPKLTGNMFCACPDFPRVFFSYYTGSTKCSTSTMATGSDRRSRDPELNIPVT